MAKAKVNKIQIYALHDPDTDEIRYIGKSVDAQKRFKAHLRENRRKTPVYLWLARLRKERKVPRLSIVSTVAAESWEAEERRVIEEYAVSGSLLNVAEGGQEPYCPREVRARNGALNSRLRTSTPRKARIYHLKRALGDLLKRGYVNERTKEKMRRAALRHPVLFGDWAAI
jgi:hypothetical protein